MAADSLSVALLCGWHKSLFLTWQSLFAHIRLLVHRGDMGGCGQHWFGKACLFHAEMNRCQGKHEKLSPEIFMYISFPLIPPWEKWDLIM